MTNYTPPYLARKLHLHAQLLSADASDLSASATDLADFADLAGLADFADLADRDDLAEYMDDITGDLHRVTKRIEAIQRLIEVLR